MRDLDDDALAGLGRANYVEFCRETGRWSAGAGHVDERGGVVLFASATAFPVLTNGVWRTDPGVPADEVLDRAEQFFADRGTGYTLLVSDHRGVDDDLAAAGEARGLVGIVDSPEMVVTERLPEKPLAPGVELRWVTDDRGVDDFVAVGGAAYATIGMPEEVFAEVVRDPALVRAPGMHSVVAYRDGAPVAAAQTLLSHGIAGVYWVGTVAEARGAGLGEAVTRAVTNLAFDLGARAQTLQASQQGEPIYRRMGYRELHRYRGLVAFEPPGA